MKNERWDLPSLVGALATAQSAAAAGIGIEIPDGLGHAAVVTLASEPGLKIVAGVDGGEIQFSVALERVSEVPDSAEFDRNLLRANKLMTLSTFGVTGVDGEEWYEVFGQMSSGSDIESVVEEIVALGQNAEEALETIVAWQTERAATAQAKGA